MSSEKFEHTIMTEFELKFEVSPAALTGVSAAMRQGKLTRQRLQASYFDTADGTLAQHGIVVRLRKEGRRWVQTAKAPTADLLARLEHNAAVALPAAGTVPTPDLSRHRGTPVGDAIDKALGRTADQTCPELHLLYGTDIKRVTTCIAVNDSLIELALDQGRVFSGGHSQAVCELEVELKQGLPIDAAALARQWCNAHSLWLSTIAKSMKGQRLGRAVPFGPATPAASPDYSKQATGHEMVTAVVALCLAQVLPNMSEVASGSQQSDHVHQLRVGIRRLRTALTELGDLADAAAVIDPQWKAALIHVFRALGAHRDHSNQVTVLQPQMLAAGGPDLHNDAADTDAAKSPMVDISQRAEIGISQRADVQSLADLESLADLGELVRAPDFQDALLGLIAFVQYRCPSPTHASNSLIKTMSRRLNKLYKSAMRDGKRFLSLAPEQQHDVRKRLKRLRYLIEFAAPLFAARKVQHMTAALKPVQNALGLYNDELMALQTWRTSAELDPKAWFGAGWLAARQQPNAERCFQEIRKFAHIKPFWKN